MTFEYPEPTTATYVLSGVVVVGMAMAVYAQFTEPFSGTPIGFWSRVVLPVGVSLLTLSRIAPRRLRAPAALVGMVATVAGLMMIVARHLS